VNHLNRGLSRRSLLAAAAGVPLATLLASCGNDDDSTAGNNNLALAHWMGGKFAEGFLPAMAKKSPVVVADRPTPYNDHLQLFLTQMASGNAPDIIMLDAGWNGDIYPNDLLVPLNDYIDEKKLDLGKWNMDLKQAYGFDGKILAWPLQTGQTPVVYINKEMAEADGLLAEAPLFGTDRFDTWKWDTFIDWLKAGTRIRRDGTVERYGLSYADTTGWVYLRSLVASLGAELLDDAWNYDETTSLLNSEPVLEAAQLLADAVLLHKVVPPPAVEGSIQGGTWRAKRAMTNIQWSDPGVYPEDQVFPQEEIHMPYLEKKVAAVGFNSLAINKNSKNADAAMEWLGTFNTDPDIRAVTLEILAPPAYDPVPIIEAAADSRGKKLAQIGMSRYAEPDVVLFPRWNGRYAGNLIDREINSALERIYLGDQSVREAFTAAKEAVDEQIKRKRETAGK
jgi:ABC-type glycerol-3-phosphate transport system substrate-binding protein